jgi:AcrR family transcriptional regulator
MSSPPQSPDLGPRERMVRSAMALICVQGVSGTGMRQVVEHAGAPRGSLQHYFPRGKDQLVQEALALAGRAASRSARPRDGAEPARPSDVLATMVDAWRTWLVESDYALGCPVVATVADAASSNPAIRTATEEAFGAWQQEVAAALAEAGVPVGRTTALAGVLISALEGAIVLSRARRSLQPLDDVRTELAPLLDGAAG